MQSALREGTGESSGCRAGWRRAVTYPAGTARGNDNVFYQDGLLVAAQPCAWLPRATPPRNEVTRGKG